MEASTCQNKPNMDERTSKEFTATQTDKPKTTTDITNTSSSRKISEGENVEDIKKFIEEQEQEINKQNDQPDEKILNDGKVNDDYNVRNDGNNEILNELAEPMVIATSVMDMILSESEAKIVTKKNIKLIPQKLNTGDKGNSVSLSVGSKVEAKDYGEFWHPALIVEVDYDEMEVLVHYENSPNKHDEWISVNSPRLRLVNKSTPIIPVQAVQNEVKSEIKEDTKQEEKPKLQYMVGERCLARWRDNRRFVATILSDLGNGRYEIMFDDGYKWKCTTSRMCKLKESKTEPLSIDTSMSPSASSLSPVIPGTGPTGNSQLAFHTHLFDPTRDYLGSKSERREMKRKLNIKEIFNIGQKKQKKKGPSQEKPKIVKEKKPKVIKKKTEVKPEVELAVSEITMEIKKEIPDAVASIIGTVNEADKEITDTILDVDEQPIKNEAKSEDNEAYEDGEDPEMDPNDVVNPNMVDDTIVSNSDLLVPSDLGFHQTEPLSDPVMDEEVKLEQFEKPDESKQEVIEKMKEVICKLEGGLEIDKIDSPKPESKDTKPVSEVNTKVSDDKSKRKLSKVKKSKKLRLLQEKRVKKQVEKVKSELEEMKRQVEEMRKQMLLKTEELAVRPHEMPESFLLPGEWCCKWKNGQPVGTVSEIEEKTEGNKGLTRMSVQVDDKRLPPGWAKHMVRRSFGQSAGKWDVVLVGPDNRRFHTKTDMRSYLEHHHDTLKPYEQALLDFGVHLKLSRRMGWYSTDTGVIPPLRKRKKLNMNRKDGKKRKKEKSAKHNISVEDLPGTSGQTFYPEGCGVPLGNPAEDDDSVYVGSLKVQIIDNLLRCPAEGCLKNFRNTTLLQMHIKHYHREMRQMLGATPKVLDLARERTKPSDNEVKKTEFESKIIKVKLPKLPKRTEEPKIEVKEPIVSDTRAGTPTKLEMPIPRSQDSPKLRQALANKPIKRPKVLLPVRRLDPEEPVEENVDNLMVTEKSEFDCDISSQTPMKPFEEFRRKSEKKRKCFSTVSRRPISEEDDWFGMNSDFETRSSFPGSGTPDSKTMDKLIPPVSSESNEDQKDSKMYMYTETGERIKLEHMKREEIINCHCGFREEDGLMVQCELCLCWQHALCHNIQREAEVPEKYTCSICLNPRRGRRSKRFLHDQDRLYEGLLPGAKPCESLRRSHELSANLLKIQDALHAMRVKYYVATKKDHPKLYLWAKDWESPEVNFAQDCLNSDYSDLNIIVNNIGKENLPLKPDEVNAHLDMRMPITEESDHERFSQRDNSLLSLTTALSSPSGASLDLPITTSELERLAKSVQEQEVKRVVVPQPEAAIENSECRERLLRHVQRCQALMDARLDSIEAQVAELESQDPSFEDDETADFFPRTKQTIQMMMRDLDTMEELGIIT